jgi:uncharacterized protein (DUF608 family)
MSQPKTTSSCESQDCGCQNGLNRREFVSALGLGTAAALASNMPVMAGPFDTTELVPADKKLSPEWVKSLTARGTRTVYRGKELELIGMPIGGICTGQLYLGGDGRLWRWDIFNQHRGTGDRHYANPPKPDFPVEQGFTLQIKEGEKTTDWPLATGGFSEISFTGEYPIGYVEYRDPKCPVTVSLEAFSPFTPLDPEGSHLPATVMRFTVKNTSQGKVECALEGRLQNAVCLYSGKAGAGERRNRVYEPMYSCFAFLDCIAVPTPTPKETSSRPDIVFDDFQKETYEGWQVTGEAFGKGPILKSQIPHYQGDVGSKGQRVVNSHATAPGKDVGEKDNATGTLASKTFTIERNFINFWIGGGNHPGKTCINLLVDGKVVRSATGHNHNTMRRESFDVKEFAGKTAQLQIVDNQKGPWGNIGVAEIVFSDKRAEPAKKLEEQEDFGTMGLALLGWQHSYNSPLEDLQSEDEDFVNTARGPLDQKLVGDLARDLTIEPGKEEVVTFLVTWHFPNIQHLKLPNIEGRRYGKRFKSALEVAQYVDRNFDKLCAQTKLWHDTWYDSTLPYWFLDRTFLNTSILATNTAYWFGNNRFWGWEGVGCCHGTCCHVWHYAQAMARIFPTIERTNREMVDYGLSFHADSGVIGFRGEFDQGLAVDGQAGTILRAYREHLMSPDDSFLKRNWPKIRKSIECLMARDPNKDGVLDGAQMNTLDQPWFGKIAWLSSLYVAALRAGEQMALEASDGPFAQLAAQVAAAGTRNIDQELFNGECYLHIPDKEHVKTVGSHNGCEIDQVFGQSWAFQVGLPVRVLPEERTKTALRSLWKYNFAPDVGPFRKHYKAGRWYAMAGEAGLLMCSWPKGDQARVTTGFDFYFNECMNGFEYQVAGHMIWEGMVQEGLAITRAIHDRYHASRRNPWNEVECGDHYARSMASYGVFLAACGYEYHGPKGYLAFAPRLSPENFRAAFTTAEGWGTFSQKDEGGSRKAEIAQKWGKLRLRTLALAVPEGMKPGAVTVSVAGKAVESKHAVEKRRVTITLAADAVIEAGQAIQVQIG